MEANLLLDSFVTQLWFSFGWKGLRVESVYMYSLFCSGASISLVASYIAVPCIIIGYVWGRGLHKQTWKGWSWDSLTQWSLFFKLGIPGLLMVCFEWWTFEISTIVAGAVDELQLAVNTVLMQFGMINFAVR